MTLGLAFWILMLFWVVLDVWRNYPDFRGLGGSALMFFLLLLLGWKLFGPPIHS